MAYPSRFKQLEVKYGKPIAEILVDKLNEHDGNISQIAKDFDMTYANVYDKVKAIRPVKTPGRWSLPETEADRAV